MFKLLMLNKYLATDWNTWQGFANVIFEVKQGLAMLVLGWVTAWVYLSYCVGLDFSCRFLWLGTVS